MTDETFSVYLRRTFRLSPQEVSLLLLLMNKKVVSSEIIYERLGIATEVRVAIFRLRKTMAKHGLPIESKRYFGYWLSDETKNKIKIAVANRIREDN